MTLLLTRRDVADLLSLDDCIEAVEDAFRLLGRGEVPRPAIAGVHATGGGFHIKAAIAGERFAAKMGAEAVPAPVWADIVVTCTPSRAAFLHSVQPGTFLAAVGADSEEKQEIAPELMASSKVVTDVTEQCATIGDLHHAIAARRMKREDVYAELAEVVAGRKGGRDREDETIIFDSTGMALQDVAAAAIGYERAV